MDPLRAHFARLYPDHRVIAIEPLAPDAGADTDAAASAKVAGYGKPVRVTLVDASGARLERVWHTAAPNEFGHDRRADRAADALLAYDDFARVPQHVQAIDVGAVGASGELISLRDAGELYLITAYARGTLYADELRHAAHAGATAHDRQRVDALATYLAALHAPLATPGAYRRAVRDLVGHGEGIYGIVDGYPADTAAAPPARLAALEASCAAWRWRLRDREGRLARTHGDFHPFNLVFDDAGALAVLDASRGACGEPADDLTALAVNYVLFALDVAGAWPRGLRALWHRLWASYAAARPDPDLLAVAPPWFAWRALVVCNPRFYPQMTPHARDALLGLAERTLAAGHLDPSAADELFR